MQLHCPPPHTPYLTASLMPYSCSHSHTHTTKLHCTPYSFSPPPSPLVSLQPHLIVPSEKVISEMISLFNRMMKTACAISKLEYLLEVVRLTYENIRDSRQPKKIMNDLGADGE